jgi:penicillin-binding protein 2
MGRLRVKNNLLEQRIFTGRATVAGAIVALLLFTILGRLFYLQVVQHDYYADLSQGNRIRIDPLPPDRGIIVDRRGTVLAENTPAYQLELTPEQVPDIRDTLARLATLGLVNQDNLKPLYRLVRASHKFRAVPLRLSMTDEEISRFAVHQHTFPGVEIRARLARYYPLGALGVHALGYVGAITDADMEKIDRDAYAGTSVMGKVGVEAAFEDLLHGTSGYRQMLVNAEGRSVERVGGTQIAVQDKRPRAGSDLAVALDAKLQAVAEQALAGWRGAVVAMDPMSGDVLVLASTPGFDPNLFTRGISSRDYRALADSLDRPMFNRVLRGTYPPGSTIKPLMALAGLEYGVIDPDYARPCPGWFSLPRSRHRYRDWKKTGHGHADMRDAIATSCDVYFYALADLLGIRRMHESMTHLGFGVRTGIDIPGEKPGLMPSPEWKKKAYKRPQDKVWFPGETVIVGIGQGYMLATPLQLAHATAIIAAKGRNFRPRLLTGVRDPVSGQWQRMQPVEGERVRLKDEANWDVITEGMLRVTESNRGTAFGALRGTPYHVAGKTGTAQVFSIGQNQQYREADVAERLRDHALFVAFAPAEAPRLAIAVLVENGGHGASVAAPMARAIFDAYLLGKYPAPKAAANAATATDATAAGEEPVGD